MHIEVRGGQAPPEGMLEALRAALESTTGVDWVEVDGVAGRVVVARDDQDLATDLLVEVVAAVEDAHDQSEQRFALDGPDHPEDGVRDRRALVALGADALGIGVSALGASLRLSPLPTEIASLVSVVDANARLRHVIENRLGRPVTEVGLAVANAVAQSVSGGPFGLAVDALHRANLLAEAGAERRGWEERQEILHQPGAIFAPVANRPRPAPLPQGPVEIHADRIGIASLVAGGVAMATTGDPRRAASMLLAGIPKPARLGRETFCAQLGRLLARRGIAVADPEVLRRLDRLDTLVVDAALLTSPETEIGRVVLAEGADHVGVHRRLAALFDGSDPRPVRKRGGWTLGPLDALGVTDRPEIGRLGAQIAPADRFALLRAGELAAVFTVVGRPVPGARQLIESARRSELMVAVAGGDAGTTTRIGSHLAVPGGEALPESIRELQRDGCAVMLVAAGSDEAHRASDCALGVRAGEEPMPRAAHLWCPRGLVDAEYVVHAVTKAKEASRTSSAAAVGGSAVAATAALTGPSRRSGSRALTAVNLAATVAMANGARLALGLGHRRDPRPTDPPWHALAITEVLERLATGRDGLSQDEAARRAQDPAPTPSAWQLLGRSVVEELVNPLTPVLAGGSALAAATGSPVDAVMVGSVAGAGALIGGVQRFRAHRAIAMLSERTAPVARVRRNGRSVAVEADRLVPGDVVELEAADSVPADCRILEATTLQVDESSLTGESMPVEKSAEGLFAQALVDRTSMLYEGTTIAAGTAVAVVVAVGQWTEANAVLGGVEEAPEASGVEHRLRRLTTMTIPAAALGGAAVFGSGVLRGISPRAALGPAVSLAVAAIPEGLPVLATAAQLAAARRLTAQQVMVKNARAVEALGRVEVLCTDKTGTLTEGRISVHSTIIDGTTVPLGQSSEAHDRLLGAALRATPDHDGGSDLPHMTDMAFVRAAEDRGVTVRTGGPGWERTSDLPFEANRGYHATLGRSRGSLLLSVKGAPEVLTDRCTTRVGAGGRRVKLTGAGKRTITDQVDELGRRGLRVLAVAERRWSDGDGADLSGTLDDEAVGGLTLLGLVGLADPIRPTAIAAVAGMRRAGVDVVMVTGDHPSTAEGIAAEIGIAQGRRVMTGGELSEISDPQLDELLGDVSVFARVTPADKVRIVRAYQRAGRTVAMTGDGANDAPAMRLADVGLALGEHCTPAARMAADVIVSDDRIESIVEAVIEGRALWAAVRDAIAILLGGNLGEVIFTAGASALRGRSPLTARQLLLVNLLTDVAPALTVAVRPPDPAAMDRLATEGPDQSLEAPLRRAILQRALTTAGGASTAWTVASLTGRPRRAGTTALVALVSTQLGQTMLTGHRHPATVLAAVGSAAVLGGIVQTPGVSQLFDCTPLGPLAWATAIGSAGVAVAVGQVARSWA